VQTCSASRRSTHRSAALYDDISSKLERIVVKRGRNDNLTTMLAGEATVDVRDPDGIFNPDNVDVLVNICTNSELRDGHGRMVQRRRDGDP